MNKLKIKASEYANLISVSLNTIKNRIKANILNGAKEEDGIWYVYLTQDEYDNLVNRKNTINQREDSISKSLDQLKTLPEGVLIATYIEMQRLNEIQKQELMSELASLYTLLAVKEKDMDFLSRKYNDLEKSFNILKDEIKNLEQTISSLNKELSQKNKEISDLSNKLARIDIENQKLLLDKDRELLLKSQEIEELKREVERLNEELNRALDKSSF